MPDFSASLYNDKPCRSRSSLIISATLSPTNNFVLFFSIVSEFDFFVDVIYYLAQAVAYKFALAIS